VPAEAGKQSRSATLPSNPVLDMILFGRLVMRYLQDFELAVKVNCINEPPVVNANKKVLINSSLQLSGLVGVCNGSDGGGG
jgi:hypothetical protein